MDDKRKNLLPTFLQETQKKLPIIGSFLSTRNSTNCDLSALDAAFRAAHTIKGAAGLLKADSIRAIALRLEDNLEKHLLQKTSPTQIEYDALVLAKEKMSILVDGLEYSQSEPDGLVKGVMQALDLAEAFSGGPAGMVGHTSELSATDPFADDALWDYTDEPSYDIGSGEVQLEQTMPEDIFADDSQFDLLTSSDEGEPICVPETVYFDPFAEDPDFEPGSPHF